ncbi:Gfo/Idh/MocA family oxidoreductase [Pelagicoccus sp. SDUM812002]|uniref:Gfo/Idh/MocA family protein n=1 Tax=Pelagicoccus sp. SDUM812002 TaxID=3041266 RepID=UPI00280F3902|nr:Gfo/Idh/MocA family oxidoreductase [Pelagicoccus sp. SDUM812002]MDQ8185727.1 Gfo/Idh/MocA family oxidoreductase [Pelagicoccus sp. SDUM812002]
MTDDLPNEKRRFAIVGTGARASMFLVALTKTFQDRCELVALCDKNPLRIQAFQHEQAANLPAFLPEDFERMIAELKVQEVIVTTVDATHHEFICRAMEAGCDVISEKPMTTDVDKCHKILDTKKKTGRNLRVTFNYRYAPRNSKVKELLDSGAIGHVHSVHFEWLLDTKHGADYFRRWHRDKANSGGLLVHKSTHHFDLVNWWLNSSPSIVYAQGDLSFYGSANAQKRGEARHYERSTGAPEAHNDPFAIDLESDATLKRLYLDCETADGYLRDRNVFGEGVTIEDDMSVIVRYENRAVMTYHLTAYSPWEGYRVAFNGSKGRMELAVIENPYVSGSAGDHNFSKNVQGGSESPVQEPTTLTVQQHWAKPVSVAIEQSNDGGHGGADAIMLKDIFDPTPTKDPLKRAASHIDGATSILTGIAANLSMASGQAIDATKMVELHGCSRPMPISH